MATKLKEYFPILKERETLLSEIQGKPELKKLFEEWTEEQQKEFLDFCTGVRGIKFLYDGFFKRSDESGVYTGAVRRVFVTDLGKSSEDSGNPSQRFHPNCR